MLKWFVKLVFIWILVNTACWGILKHPYRFYFICPLTLCVTVAGCIQWLLIWNFSCFQSTDTLQQFLREGSLTLIIGLMNSACNEDNNKIRKSRDGCRGQWGSLYRQLS